MPSSRSKSVPPRRAHRGCCSAADAADARFVAGMLGIPFYALNFQDDFEGIIDYFADEYVSGRTPNPCVVCNDRLKFGKLLDYANAVGAKYVATGHYARIGKHTIAGNGRVLMRGRDAQKDQSYVLFGLNRAILSRVMFPVGELTKAEVRAIAARFSLPNRDKPDSVEICFVPDNDYARVVRQRRPGAFVEGDVLDANDRVIGRHRGIGNYTIGQRRGLGIAAGRPIYVTRLDPDSNTVTMGERDALLASALIGDRANFLIDPPEGAFRADVKIRYLHKAAPATVQVISRVPTGESPRGLKTACLPLPCRQAGDRQAGDRQAAQETCDAGCPVAPPPPSVMVRVVFDEPQRAITPGQAAVFYDGQVVLGGAWIDGVESVEDSRATRCETRVQLKRSAVG